MENHNHGCQPTDYIIADSEPDTESLYEPDCFEFDSTTPSQPKRRPTQHDSGTPNPVQEVYLPPYCTEPNGYSQSNLNYQKSNDPPQSTKSSFVYKKYDSAEFGERHLSGNRVPSRYPGQSDLGHQNTYSHEQMYTTSYSSSSLNGITQQNYNSQGVNTDNESQNSSPNIKIPPIENSSQYGSKQSLGSQESSLSFHTVHASFGSHKDEYQQQYVPATSPHSSIRMSNQSGSTQPYTRQPSKSNSYVTSVFITYAPEDEAHLRNVVQLSQTLYQNSIAVQVDILDKKGQSESISKWLDDNFTNSDFIIICISPKYNEKVKSETSVENNIGGLKYIYRQLHREYINNGAKNYRFIPVLISGGQMNHIPSWLRDTTVFRWPNDFEDIIYRLLCKEKYVKPSRGPPPEITVVRYGSVSNK